jgi:hypothetical protein
MTKINMLMFYKSLRTFFNEPVLDVQEMSAVFRIFPIFANESVSLI